VHALPVVADIRAAHSEAVVDWVVEPGFASLLGRVRGIAEVIELPLRRWGKPRDLTGVAIFLSSEAASYVTGQQIVVDGGYTISL